MKTIFLVLLSLFVISCSKPHTSQNSVSKKVLFVTSNATHYGNTTITTTNNFPEIVYAYHEFEKAGIVVDFVSPEGGQVPIGYIHSADSILQKYLFDEVLMRKLKYTFKPSEIDTDAYQAIYYVGGGSAMFGVPENKAIQQLAQHIVEKNKGILSAICHGTAGIVNIQKSNGDYMIKGHKITGFPNAFEDTTATYYKQFPFSIDKMITKHGATFTYSAKGWDEYLIVGDNIITGQDPTSAHLVAQKIIQNINQKTEQ